MDGTIRKNDRCFIGLPSCGYGFESAKMCFVACPSDEKYTLKIEIIQNIVVSKQYECHIALRIIDPGNLAFCTKICSKIIQSQFCIALLDPSVYENNEKEYPNPNVHMEYGMMMSQNKHIIPLQDKKYELPFNISPLDTIKYREATFKSQVTEAVDNAIKKFSEKKVPGAIPPGPEIYTFYNLLGYKIANIIPNFYKFLYDLGSHLGFFLFNFKEKIKYVGPFDYEDPKKGILHTKLLIDNIISTYEGSILFNAEEAKRGIYEYLINDISIDIIISSVFDKEDVMDKINNIINNKYGYPIAIYHRVDFQKKVDEQYKSIGEIKSIKPAKVTNNKKP